MTKHIPECLHNLLARVTAVYQVVLFHLHGLHLLFDGLHVAAGPGCCKGQHIEGQEEGQEELSLYN